MDIGDKHKLAFVIGERSGRDLRVVDIYIVNELITFYDNTAYIPQFTYSIECEATDIENKNIYDDYFFLDCGPTTDDVKARGFIEEGCVHLHCELDNGKIVEAKLPVNYVITIYRSVAKTLREMQA
ncbi:MAG: hypothetical protein ABW170_21990 [Candidatus Thiodiazotropha sp. L084R]